MSQFRSVNDFDSPDGLKAALRCNDRRQAFADERDFPSALIGSSVAVNGVAEADLDSMSVTSEMSSVVEPDGELEWVLTNYHAETSHSQSLKEELKRLQVLKSYLILDSEREARFEQLTGLASKIFQVPVALVSLVDLGRIWFMSNRGLGDVREISRDNAFCAHAIISKDDMLIVDDLTQDGRFKEHPLVVGWPNFRYYAGVPLVCPEGYKLGTFCLLDNKARPSLTLDQKQMLGELANMVVSAMVDRRREKMRVLADKSHRLAATAHDLLTPLSGVQMSLSLLREDEELKHRLTENQMELVSTAESCAGVMNRICHAAMDSFRGDLLAGSAKAKPSLQRRASTPASSSSENPIKQIKLAELVQSLNMVMEPYPKQVPLFIMVDPRTPPVIVSDDLKLFRSALNLLTNAAKKTTSGSIQLNIFASKMKESPKLVFECVDTGPGVGLALYPYLFRPFREEVGDGGRRPEAFAPCIRLDGEAVVSGGNACAASMDNSGLGLYSVANQISSLGGEYGFRPRDEGSGAIFWFSIPLDVPKPVDATISRLPATNGLTGNAAKTGIIATNGHQETFVPAETATPTLSSLESKPSTATLTVQDGASRRDNGIPKVVHGVNGTNRSVNCAASDKRKRAEPAKSQRTRQALVIDDSLVIRKSISRAMKKLGFEVDVASNGLEGFKHLQAEIYDITFCDYLMPVMDGLDCVKQYREWENTHRPWLRQHIVGVSAHASANDIEKGKEVGMDDFKAKPVTLKVLKQLAESEEICRIGEKLDSVLDPQDGDMDALSDLEDTMSWSYRSSKKARSDGTQPKDSGGKACLIAEESVGTMSNMVKAELDSRGWQFVAVSDGEDALRLMKMRNWGVIYLDEDLPRLTGVRCMERFRAWEGENRIKRQNSVFLVSASFVPSPSKTNQSSSGSFPSGFDGALGKPILPKDFRTLLMKAEGRISMTADPADILHR